MSKEIVLPEPQRLASIDRDIFGDLRRIIGSRQQTMHPSYYQGEISDRSFRDELGRRNGKRAYRSLEGLLSIASIPIRSVVQVDLDFRDVRPQSTQRNARNWHKDGLLTSVVVSDELPTQFLTGSIPEDHPLFTGDLLRKFQGYAWFDSQLEHLVDEAVNDGYLHITETEPYEAYAFTDAHLHRGQVNDKDTPVTKSYIRLS